MSELNIIAKHKNFSGEVQYIEHFANSTQCNMTFSVYLPEQSQHKKLPAIIWLSGLTCNHENFITKAGAQLYADKHGIILIMPDTSPRDVNIAGADVDYDLGYGAGFYLNATNAPWDKNFNMYNYVVNDLMRVMQTHLPIDMNKVSIMGHSMGGHGAMVIGLKNPDKFQSISAFAPICHPSVVPWGEKAFTAYLGNDKETWAEYDSCDLIKKAVKQLPLWIDQGTDDQFLKEQLKPEDLIAAAKSVEYPLQFYYRDGFDHSYYFIASFIGKHLDFHAECLAI